MIFENTGELAENMGTLAATIFIVANAYVLAKFIVRNYIKPTKEINRFLRRYLEVHIILNYVALAAVIVHWHYAGEKNILLQWVQVLTLWLVIGGILLHYRPFPGMKKHLYIFHSQQIMFIAWALLIVAGHTMV